MSNKFYALALVLSLAVVANCQAQSSSPASSSSATTMPNLNGTIPSTAKKVDPNDISPETKKLLKYYDKQIYFTENKGQWDKDVIYKAQFPLGSATVTSAGMEMSNYDPADVKARYDWGIAEEKAKHDHLPFNQQPVKVRTHDWLMKFANSSSSMTINGEEKHSDVFNYFIGNVAATNVRNYQEIWYNNVYKNVDVRYYPSAEGALEYDIVCKPGFDKKQIAIQLDGINKMHLTKDGGLVITTNVGNMSFPAPVAYQKVDGKQVAVKAKYHIDENNNLTFDLGSYNASLPLVIDPIALRWATWVNLGSTGDDHGHGIWVDNDGSIYVVSRVDGSATLEIGGLETSASGGIDLVVGKYLEPANVGGAGSRVWQTYIGGSSDDNPYALEEGPDGNIYMVGYTESSDYPLTAGGAFAGASIDERGQSGENIFITKITPDGTSIKSSVIGGGGTDNAFDLRIDPTTNNIVVCGSTSSDNLGTLFPSSGATNNANGTDVIIFKINSDLSQILWMKDYGGSGSDVANIMVQNPNTDEIFVAGSTTSSDFPVSSNAREKTLSSSGNQDGFIQKLNSSGKVEWSSYFNSAPSITGKKSTTNFNSSILCMEFNLPNYNKLYFAGITTSLFSSSNAATTNITSGALRTTYSGGNHDFFITNMDTAQNLVASTYLGGSDDEVNLMGLNVDAGSNVFIFGYSASQSAMPATATSFPVTTDALQSQNAGGDDKVFCKISSDLKTELYGTFYGGANDDYDPVGERGIKFANCRIYTIVTSLSFDIPLTVGAINTVRSTGDNHYEPGLVVWANPPDFLTNSIVGKQTVICAGSKPDSIKGTPATYSLPQITRNGTVSFYPVTYAAATYQWQYSTDSVNWTPIAGATNQNLPGGSGGLIPVLTQKTYFERVISGDACVTAGAANEVVTITTVGASGVVKEITCNGLTNGSITITGVGTSPFKFKWSTGSTNSTISGLAVGNYTVTTTDGTSCTGVNTFSITQPPALMVTANPSSPATCGSANGSASVAASGGTIPYNYIWNPSEPNGPTLTGLSGGTYYITVTDKDGCTATTSTVVGQPETVTATLTPTSPLCNGGSTGSISVSPSGGITPYSYVWSNTATTQNLSNIPSGPYAVTVTDKNGCNTIQSTTLINPPSINASALAGAILCNGGSTTLTVTASGGTGTLTYSINGGNTYQSGNTFPVNAAGSPYAVNVKDANGCTVNTNSVPVTQPSIINASAAAGTILCNNGSTTLTVTASGGTGTLTYSINGGNTYQSGNTFPVNAAGSPYTVNVKDANGCTVNTNSVPVTQPSIINASAAAGTILCNNGSTTLTVTASGGTGTLTYSINGGNTYQSGNTFPINAAGSPYTVNVKDANGCTVNTNSVPVTQPSIINASAAAGTILCNNGSTTLTVTASGGTGALAYSIDGGNSYQSGNTFPVNAAGSPYTVNVKDANGCTVNTNSVPVTQPSIINASAAAGTILCNNGSTTLTVTASGGTGTLTYSINGGNTYQSGNTFPVNAAGSPYTVNVKDANGCTVNTNSVPVTQPSIINASAEAGTIACYGGSTTLTVTASGGTGTLTYSIDGGNTYQPGNTFPVNAAGSPYTVNVKDANGCTVNTNSVPVTQPTVINASAAAGTILCNGGSTTLTVTASGGTGALTYSIDGGNSYQSGNTFPVNAAGSPYTVNVKDANGCTVNTNSVPVTQPSIINASAEAGTIACYGGSTTLTVTASGGTGTLTYSIDGGNTYQPGNTFPVNVAGSPYAVNVKDANGCTTNTNSVVVSQPDTLVASVAGTNVACNGGNNGTATLKVTGGTSPYTFNWSNTATTQNLSNLVATTYAVTVTDAHGCTDTASVVISQSGTLVSVPTTQDVSCHGGNDGYASVHVTGGVGPYTYAWSTGSADSSSDVLVATTYNVTITDANNCQLIDMITIKEPSALKSNITPTNPTCNGFNNGTATDNISGGTVPYNYFWSNGATVNSISGLGATKYVVNVFDGNGCLIKDSVTLTQPLVLADTISFTDAICSGNSDGSAGVKVGGGTSPYTFNWTGGATTQNISGLTAGQYFVTITDAEGCSVTDLASIQQPKVLNISFTPTEVSCNGGSSGMINLNVTGGTTSYSFSWSNSASTQNLSNLTATRYAVTVTDAHGCTDTASIVLTQPSAINASAAAGTILCNGGSTTLTVTASGGTGTLTYSIDGGNTYQPDNTFPVNAAGSPYTVNVKDANGCTANTNSVPVTDPTAINASASAGTIACNGGSTTLTVTASGGTGTLTYSIDGGNTYQSGNTFPVNVAGSPYTVNVKDANGCTANTNSVPVTQPTTINASAEAGTILCNGGSTTLTVTASGGTGTLTYSIDGGNTYQSDNTFPVNAAGSPYTVNVKDANGCTVNTNSVPVTQPTAINASAEAGTILCNGGSTTLTVTASGGTGTLTYSIDGGNTYQLGNTFPVNAAGSPYTVNVKDANGCTANTNSVPVTQPTVINASASAGTILCNGGSTTLTVTASGGTGTLTYSIDGGNTYQADNTFPVNAAGSPYTVNVKDANGCTANTNSVPVTQPTVINASASAGTILCNGGSTTLTVTASGGTGTLTYSIDGGNTYQADNTFPVNAAGSPYTVNVKDANGCTANTNSVPVTDPTAINASASAGSITCNVGSTTLTVTASGGTGTLIYSIDGGNTYQADNTFPVDAAGSPYTVNVKDVNGCTANTNTVQVTEPTTILASASAGTILCNSGSTTLTVTASGGTGILTYSIDGGKTYQLSNTFPVNAAGSPYTVSVKDANGCIKNTDAVVVTDPTAINASASAGTIACNGGSTTLTVTASGGTGTLTYSIDGGNTYQAGNTFPVNAAGSPYTVNVKDANGCTANTNSVVVTEPAILSTSLSPTSPTCHAGSNGSITQIPSGGTLPYSFIWSNNATTQNLSNIIAAGYDVTVTDKNGCTAFQKTSLSNPADLAVTPSHNDVTCNGLADGSIDLSVTGGTGAYTYAWSNSQTTSGISGLDSATYVVTVTDANQCDTTLQITVGQPARLGLMGTTTPVKCNGYTDGSVSITVTGGTYPYTYEWTGGATSQDISGLGTGKYTVIVTDFNECHTMKQFMVGDVPAIVVGGTPTPTICNGSATGSITLNVTGGSGPGTYTYNWLPSTAGTNLSSLIAGNYYVTATDANGCTGTNEFTVTDAPAIIPSISHVNTNSCQGGNCNGSISLSITSGGVSPFTFNWSNGETSQNISGLCQSRYYVTITDANGCTASSNDTVDCCPTSITIAKNLFPKLVLPPSNDWQFTSTIPGNQNFTLPAAGGSLTFNGMPLGTYTVTEVPVKNWIPSNTCALDSNIAVITVNTCGNYTCTFTNTQRGTPPCPTPLSIKLDSTDVTCYGAGNGTISLTTNEGAGAYTYTWSNGATTQNISGLNGNTYCVTVTFTQGCSSSASACIKVNEPNQLKIVCNSQPNICYGANNGITKITPTGGTSPYTYNWSSGQTTQNISGLVAGTYYVTVTDKNKCSATGSYTINQNPAIHVTVTPTNCTTSSDCHNGCNGKIVASATGGVMPYTYKWSNGANTATISNICGGTYYVTVMDYAGCTKLDTATIVCIPVCNITLSSYCQQNICYGSQNGSINLTVNNATQPITYIWSNGKTTQNINGLAAGPYSVTVTDKNKCSATATFTIGQDPALYLNVTGTNCTTSSDCHNGCNGKVSASGSGGIAPYRYHWSTGDNTATVNGLCGGTYYVTVTDYAGCVKTGSTSIVCIPVCNITLSGSCQQNVCYGSQNGSINLAVGNATLPVTFTWSNGKTTQDINGLAAGPYSVTVTDKNKCSATASFNITQDPCLYVSVSGTNCTTSSDCHNGCNGKVVASGSGGIAPYKYHWSTGDNTATVNNLCGGTYYVTVTDYAGCIKTGSTTIVCVPVCNITLSSYCQQNVCYGSQNGSINLTVNNATAPITYIWSNGKTTQNINSLAAGTYYVTVTDKNKCSATGTFTISQDPCLYVTVTGTNCTTSSDCHNGCNGKVSASGSGGIAPYRYHWSTGDNTATVNGLCGGTYYVTVTDYAGCVKTGSTAIVCVPVCNITLSGSCQQNVCYGSQNGSINLTVNNATAPITYIWSNGKTTQNINGLAAGTYYVTVTDRNKCSATGSFNISQDPCLYVSTTPVNCTSSGDCHSGCNGKVSASGSGGIAPYKYHWSTGDNSATVNNLCGGTYYVTVTDYAGCVKTGSVTITCISPCNIKLSATTQSVTCGGQNTGAINLSVSGATGFVYYKWSNGKTTQDIYNLCAGSYTVTVTDSKGCSATGTFKVSGNSALNLTISHSNCTGRGCNGNASISVSGGVQPYKYRWSNGSNNSSVNGLCSGCTYYVTVTDYDGCYQVACVTITSGYSASARIDESQSESTDSTGTASLSMNTYPNPFSAEATIEFVSPVNTNGTLQIINVSGQVIEVIYTGKIDAGIKYTFLLHGEELASGMYFSRLVTEDGVYTKNMIKTR